MPPMLAWDGRWEWSTQSTEGWEWGLLSTPWRPDRAHTLKVKSKANGKMTGKGAGSQSHLLQIQIQACLLALFSVYGCMVIQPYLGGQKKKKKSSFWMQIKHICWGSFRQMWENIRPAAAEIRVFLRTLTPPNAPSKSTWGADGTVRFLILWSLFGKTKRHL